MIPADLLELLRCPQSGQTLSVAGPEVLASIKPPLTEALLREDRLVLYPVRDGIPVLLAEEAIRL